MKAPSSILAALLLAACTHPVATPLPPHTRTFSEWQSNLQNCTITARGNDFTLITDGRIPGNILTLRLTFTPPLIRPPYAALTGLPVAIPVEGARKTYNVILAYDPTTAAHMLAPNTLLGIYYQPLNSALTLQSTFSTRNLMFALAELDKNCP